jgi:hypothetical protein
VRGWSVAVRDVRIGVVDFYAARPWVDLLAVALLGLLWVLAGAELLTPSSAAARLEFYVGVATLAALVLAAATFVCTMVYQSASPHVETVRKRFGATLRTNWTAIIAWSLLAAASPIVAILLDEKYPAWAMAISVVALGLIVMRFARSVYWLRLTLFLQHVSDAADPVYVVKMPVRKAG